MIDLPSLEKCNIHYLPNIELTQLVELTYNQNLIYIFRLFNISCHGNTLLCQKWHQNELQEIIIIRVNILIKYSLIIQSVILY